MTNAGGVFSHLAHLLTCVVSCRACPYVGRFQASVNYCKIATYGLHPHNVFGGCRTSALRGAVEIQPFSRFSVANGIAPGENHQIALNGKLLCIQVKQHHRYGQHE